MGTSRKLTSEALADKVRANPRPKHISSKVKDPSIIKAAKSFGRASGSSSAKSEPGKASLAKSSLVRSSLAKSSLAKSSSATSLMAKNSSKKSKLDEAHSSRRKVSISAARIAQNPSKLKETNPAKSVVLKRAAKSRAAPIVTAVIKPSINPAPLKKALSEDISSKGAIIKSKEKGYKSSSEVAINNVIVSKPSFRATSDIADLSPTSSDLKEGRIIGSALDNPANAIKNSSGSLVAANTQSAFVVNPQVFRPRPVIQPPAGKGELFEAGDKVVYPGHGVGILDEVVTKNVGGADHTFYGITILDSKHTKIMVPVSQAHMVGLRKIVSMQQMQEVFEILRRRSTKVDLKAGNGQTWNRRSRDYTLKLKTGSLLEIAEVTRELAVLSKSKELSFGERKMLESAQYLLVSELALVKDRSHEAILGELQELMS